jgi:hypothetical protein
MVRQLIMTTVHRPGSTPLPSRTTDLLKVKVSENDPMMKVVATAFGFKVTGASTISGTKPSVLNLEFDGKKVALRISRGDTGEDILTKLKSALPPGYQARLLQMDKSKPPQVTIGIAHRSGPAPRENVSKIPTSTAANMASANVSASIYENAMPGSPHPNAHATINVSGTGFADAPPKFAVKSISVYEKGTNKLVATIENPKVQGSSIQWGQKTQTYKLDVPKKDLDVHKQYTFVVNTGINGSKPEKVRSEYVSVMVAH